MREGTGTSSVIAGTIVAFGMALGAVLAITIYISITVYAVVKWIGSSSDAANPVVILLIMVVSTGTFVTLLGLAINLFGRSMTPRRRRRAEPEPFDFGPHSTIGG
jgi:F0F1-type ATP synthase membrane subunit a